MLTILWYNICYRIKDYFFGHRYQFMDEAWLQEFRRSRM